MAPQEHSETLGLPWWPNSKESPCQCRGHRFDPWSRRIPRATRQLRPCPTNAEARVPQSPCCAARQVAARDARAPHLQGSPAHSDQRALTRSTAHSAQTPAHHTSRAAPLTATREHSRAALHTQRGKAHRHSSTETATDSRVRGRAAEACGLCSKPPQESEHQKGVRHTSFLASQCV